MIDHVFSRPPIASESQYIPDCFVGISYVVSQTSKIKVGSLVSPVLLRGPGYLSKLSYEMNVLSRGRLIIGLGAGWFEDEFSCYGIEFPRPSERILLIEEAIAKIRNPDPQDAADIQSATSVAPIWVGGSGEKVTLALVARLADGCNLQGNTSSVERKISVLRRHCSAYSRNLEDVAISKQSNVIIDRSEGGVVSKLRETVPDESKWKAFKENNFVGTPDECLTQIVQLTKLGISYFTLNFPDLFDLDCMRLFSKEVVAPLQQVAFA